MPHTWDPNTLSPEDALQRLVEGNRRFREGCGASMARAWSPQLAAEAQRPFAIILGCFDSRTPVEILFDQGFGDLMADLTNRSSQKRSPVPPVAGFVTHSYRTRSVLPRRTIVLRLLWGKVELQ